MHFAFLDPEDFDIIWLSNILALSVPDEGLFQKHVQLSKLDIYVFIFSYMFTELYQEM